MCAFSREEKIHAANSNIFPMADPDGAQLFQKEGSHQPGSQSRRQSKPKNFTFSLLVLTLKSLNPKFRSEIRIFKSMADISSKRRPEQSRGHVSSLVGLG
jgi:hypothetical protein